MRMTTNKVDGFEHYGESQEETISARIKAGELFMQSYYQRSRRNCNRYLDSSASSSLAKLYGDEKPKDVPVGEINYIAMNIRQKVAHTTTGSPDFRLESDMPEAIGLVRDWLKKTWHKNKWGRIFRRIATARYVTGMGFAAYSWDRGEGFVLEYLAFDDVIYDPHTLDDGWDNPRWAAKRVRLPCDVAYSRYGEQVFTSSSAYLSGGNEKEANKTYDIWVYYDKNIEAEVFGDKVLSVRENLYGRVPIRALCGDINPNGEFPLSDYDTSLGIFEMLRRQQNVLNNVAAHGGGIPWLRSEFIDDRILENVINGTHRGYVVVKGVPGEQAVGYTPNQPLSSANLESIKMLSLGLDADQGVNDLDRGVTEVKGESATQTALRSQKSGSRGNLARGDFEQFVEDIVNELIRLTVQFGLDSEMQEIEEADVLIWGALSSITSCRLIEESLSYQEPAMRQQQAMQLYTLATSNFQLMNALGFAPNLKKLFDDILRCFDHADVDDYYLPSAGIAGGENELRDDFAAPGEHLREPQASAANSSWGGAGN